MADETKPDKPARVVIDRTNVPKAANFVEIYANDTYIQTSPWDVRLMLGVLTELGPDQNTPSPLRVADVRMSLHHAKKVAQLLTKQISQYERDHGPLILPGDKDDEA
jgi:uncharacterized protein DUF3467